MKIIVYFPLPHEYSTALSFLMMIEEQRQFNLSLAAKYMETCYLKCSIKDYIVGNSYQSRSKIICTPSVNLNVKEAVSALYSLGADVVIEEDDVLVSKIANLKKL